MRALNCTHAIRSVDVRVSSFLSSKRSTKSRAFAHMHKLKMRQTSSLSAIILIASVVIVDLVARISAVCPNAEDIKPCTCDDEGLQCLRLSQTALKRIFQAPAERKAIRRVWIFQTNLTELPKQAFGDYIIRDLYLDLNQIKRIESGAFGEATKTLQSLSLTRNLLSEFPFEDLASMQKLRQIGLGYNQLRRLKADAFPSSETLESIDLSHNLISDIGPNAFAKLTEVSLIDLSRNQLFSVESQALQVKSTSRQLAISLRGNQLSKIAADAFGAYHPNSLDLSRNQFKYLEQLTFEPLLRNNTTIFVEGCELYRWLLELEQEALSNLINFSCTDETKLEDLTLEMIGCTGDKI